MSVIRTIAQTFATKGAGFLITLLVGVTLFRTIGPAGKGTVDGLITWLTLLLLAYPSLEEPQLYLIGRRDASPATFVVNALIAAALFGGLVIGLLELIARHAPGWLEYHDRRADVWRTIDLTHLRTLALVAPLALAQRACGGVLQGLRDMGAFNACFLIQNTTLLVCVVSLVWVGGRGVEGAVIAYVASFGAGGLSAILMALRHPEVRKGPWMPAPRLLGRLCISGLRIHGGVVAAWLILESDKLVVLRYHDADQLALYVLAVALTGHLRRLVVQPVKEVLGSRLPGMVGDRDRLIDAVSRTCRHIVLLTVIPGAALALFGWPILWVLYGAEAVPAYIPLLVLLPGSLLWGAAVIQSYWFIGTDRFVTLTMIGLAMAGTNLALNFAFVPEHGVIAAAASSTCCYALHLTIFTIWIGRAEGVKASRFLRPRREDLSVYSDAWAKVMGALGRRR